MRKQNVAIAAALATAIIAIAISLPLAYAPSTAGGPDPRPRMPAGDRPPARPEATVRGGSTQEPPRSVADVEGRTDRRSTTLPATVEPSETVEVVPDVAGLIERLAVDIGATVHRGDLLAELRAPGRDYLLARARVGVQQARARVNTARAGVKVADTEVSTARAELEASQATLTQAEATSSYRRRQYERIAELVKKGALQNRIGEEEQARIRTDDAGQVAARARVAIVRASLTTAEAKLEEAGARLAEAEEALHLAELDHEEARAGLEALRIRSPIDGVISRRRGHVGAAVRPSADGESGAIFTVAGTQHLRIVAQVSDRDAPLVDVGAPSSFRPEARPASEYRGSVSRTSVALDPSTHTMRVEVDLGDEAGGLRPGQRGTVRIDLRTGP